MSSFTDALARLRKRKDGSPDKPDNRSDKKVAASVYKSAMDNLHPGYLAKKRAANILLKLGLGLSFGAAVYSVVSATTGKVIVDDMRKDMVMKMHAVFLALVLCALGSGLFFGVGEVSDEDVIKEASNLIVELKRKFPNMPMAATTEQIQRLWDVLPDVIRHINPKDRAKLESLARKKDRIPDETYFQQVSEIVSRHLGENSADLETVLNAYRGIITLNAAKQYWARGKSFEPVR